MRGIVPGARCDHCGDDLEGLKVERRRLGSGWHNYCCLGCAFIAEQLHLALADGAQPGAGPAATEGEPAAAGVAEAVAPDARVVLRIEGMVCGACALLLAHRLSRTPGVSAAQVDFSMRRAEVAFDARRTGPQDLARVVRRTGYRVVDERHPLAPDRRARRVELLRVLVAWLAMMQVMMLAVPAYLADPGDVAPDIEQLLRIAQLVLSLPVMLFSAVPLLRAAASQLRVRAVAMDLPIAVGLVAAFAASVRATWLAEGHVYFDSITMFVALVLAVRAWQARALSAAAAHVDRAMDASRLRAQRLVDYPRSAACEAVDADQLRPGDCVRVDPGAVVPADGRVRSGCGSVSQAWLTGESTPVARREGDAVLAGSLNGDQPLVVDVTRAGEATSLAELKRLMSAAAFRKPRLAQLADRAAGAFLWGVLAVAALTAAAWAWIDPSQALPNTIAVLVVTCPCALALAAPAVLATAQAALARRGVLVARAAALEALARADVVVTDKTGTLTEPHPELRRVEALREVGPESLLAVAASLESLSAHPFAAAVVRAAESARLHVGRPFDLRLHPSEGVEGHVDGRLYRMGTADFALALAGTPGTAATPAGDAEVLRRRLRERIERIERDGEGSTVVLADVCGPLGVFVFGEALREGAAALVRGLQEGRRTVQLLSGDRRAPVERVARQVGIEPAAAFAHLTPSDKRARVERLQAAGRKVAMIGDGVNDAPVLAQADVSIALADGADLAQARADLIALRSRPDDVAAAFVVARRTVRLMRENLAWALSYNLLAVPLAALGYVSPALAAAGMAASSLLVVANALRAGRIGTRATTGAARGGGADGSADPLRHSGREVGDRAADRAELDQRANAA